MSLFLKLRQLSALRTSSILRNWPERHISTTCTTHALIRRPTQETEAKLMERDKVPTNYELIYRAPMENYISAAKNTSTITATLVSILAAFKFASDINYFTVPFEINYGDLVAHDTDIWWFAAGFVGINAAIRVVVSLYALRIYKSEEKYMAIYDSQLPFLTSQHTFEKGQISEVHNVLNPWTDSMYRLGGRSSLLLIDYFKTPSEFHNMCGLK